MEKNDGGPAFPRPSAGEGYGEYRYHDGMSLRDWFAGQAPAAPERWREWWLNTVLGLEDRQYNPHKDDPRLRAAWAYDYADAMLAAREGND